MHWLQQLDTELFRYLNLRLVNPVFDKVMPFLSGNPYFLPFLVLVGILLLWKGGVRGRVCLVLAVLAVGLTDGVVCRAIKHDIGRVRPCLALSGVHCLLGKSHSGSMPSAHAANWFAAVMVAFIYYRRSLRFMLPAALAVSFSRIYNGVHYPSDVLAGAILGAGGGAAVVWLFDTLWARAGQKYFPLWWERMPSVANPVIVQDDVEPESAPGVLARGSAPLVPSVSATLRAVPRVAPAPVEAPQATLDQHWMRLGYILIVVLCLVRLAYLASGTIQLAEDEAYQWLWSKHLALSYYSKPPLIAYTQFLGTHLWGDTAFGVRFFSPVISALLGFLALRFFAREVNARAGFFLLLILTATPLLAAGSILMTIDPLSVLFWTAAMLAGWRAVQENGATGDWLWVGLWTGLGFLSKYTELFQLLCWAVFFALRPAARKHLRRRGPYLALLLAFVCALPVLIWNYQHHWITVQDVAGDAGAGQAWKPTLSFLGDFLGAELGLLNPVFFVAMIWAAIAFWRRGRHNPLLVYFFSMGAPLFLVYLLYTFHSRVLPNWIAPSVLPLFMLMVAFWDTRLRLGSGRVKASLTAGLGLGLVMVLMAHNTDLIEKITGRYLPVNYDPLHRVREWKETATVVGQVRDGLLTEGKPVFIIAAHYGLTGEISFYLPEAKKAVGHTPLVYYQNTARPENQFYFWPGYSSRKGENAIYVHELDRDDVKPQPPPPRLKREFESVTSLGVRDILYHGMLVRPLQFFACRGLK